jgi:hypothetical protein
VYNHIHISVYNHMWATSLRTVVFSDIALLCSDHRGRGTLEPMVVAWRLRRLGKTERSHESIWDVQRVTFYAAYGAQLRPTAVRPIFNQPASPLADTAV